MFIRLLSRGIGRARSFSSAQQEHLAYPVIIRLKTVSQSTNCQLSPPCDIIVLQLKVVLLLP